MNTSQRILKNFLSLTSADVTMKLLSMVAIAYLARILGPGDFGKLNFALASVGYFAIIAHFGINTIGTRDIARDKQNLTFYVNNVISLKLCMGILSYMLLLIFALTMHKTMDIKYLIILYGFTLFSANVFLCDWVFQGIEKMEYQAIASIIEGILYTALILIIVKTNNNLLIVPAILIAAQSVSAVFLFYVLFKKLAVKLHFDLSYWKYLFKQALPLGLTGMASIIINYFNVMLLGLVRTNEEVGYFSASHKIILLLMTTIAILATATFPTISFLYKNSKGSFDKLVSYLFKLTITLGMPAAIGIMILAKPIINLIYGAKYGDSQIILQILIWNFFLVGINTIYSRILWAADKQNQVFKIVLFQALLVAILNLFFTPSFGIYSAGIIAVFGEMFGFLLYNQETKNIIKLNLFTYLHKPLLSALVMSCFLISLSHLNLFSLIFSGIAIYFICLYFLKGVDKNDLEIISQLKNSLWLKRY
ncbi:MAG: flippase [Elusimicrobia bacterium]|nr:flippase [Elusimicrobiota bacterium]